MKNILFVILIFASCSVFADELDFSYLPEDQRNELLAFKLLTPVEQLDYILQEPPRSGMLGMDKIRRRLVFLENPEAKPLLFARFNSIEVPCNTDSMGQHIYHIFISMFIGELYSQNLLSRNEEIRLADIFEKHMHYYLKTYKKLDDFSIFFEIIINRLRDGEDITFNPGYGLRTYEKYKAMGYEDLKYEYKEYIRAQP
jgi:hypothetical protein